MAMLSDTHAYIKKSTTAGNGLFVEKDLEAGELILKLSRPLVAALDSTRLEDTCANCYARKTSLAIRNREYGNPDERTFQVSACTGCNVVRYCGKKCQSRAWKRHHKVNCKLYSSIPTKLLSNAVRAILQVRAMEYLGTLEDYWHSFTELASHADQFIAQHRKYWIETEQVLSVMEKFCKEELHVRGMPKQHLHGRILTNSLTLVTPVFDPIGICLDPLVAAANHSCDPNAAIVMDGPELSLRSLRPLDKDEEIFIAYIDTTNAYSYRQYELQNRYFFKCSCTKCRKGPALPEDKLFDLPVRLPSPEWEASIQSLDASLARKPEFYVEDDPSQRKAAIQAIGYTKLKCAKDLQSFEAVAMIESGMQDCFQSGLFSLTRQPYAALRHSLMVNLIPCGKYDIAFMQGVKIYCQVDPDIFPESFHPVRVARNWVLLRLLCALLADHRYRHCMSEMMATTGIDFAVIVYHMFNDLNQDVKKSHGSDSSLAKTIAEEFDVTLDTLDARDAAVQHAYNEARTEHFTKLKRLGEIVEV